MYTADNSTDSPSIGLPPALVAILQPLASLKLTVTLLCCAVFVTWIATLDQATIDIWELKRKHFSSFQVYVPFQTFFVPAWFPEWQNVPFGIWVPSGFTIIVAMLVNLTAAHLLRFKLQAESTRLACGLLVAIMAGLVTWAVIFSGAEQREFQGQPPVSYRTMWTWMQVGLAAISFGAILFSYIMPQRHLIEKLLLGLGGLFGIATLALVFSLGEKGFLGDSAMRILWQLLLSTFAATVALASCILLFRRRAGIVLLHLGIAGLLVNEIYVTMTNTEQQMLIEEGQTQSIAVDIRYVELAVIDRSGEKDKVISIPGDLLQSMAGTEERISNADVPFEIRVDEYFVNSKLDETARETSSDWKGLAEEYGLVAVPPVPGTETKKRNFAAAKVELFDKTSGDSLGKYILSQRVYFADVVETVEVGSQEFWLAMRDREFHKPYKITLKDVQRRNYPGTNRPQWFASEFDFIDSTDNTVSSQRIWMNNPMRYAGETFYQQSYIEADGSFKERTVIQIVKNRGWMIPYVCCMFTVVGLTFQFGKSLLGFLKKSQTNNLVPDMERDEPGFGGALSALFSRRPKSSAKTAALDNRPGQKWSGRIIFLVFLLYVLGKLSGALRPGKSDEFRWDRFGQIPVTYDGRVKPLDSMARDLARQLCNREVVGYRTHIKKPKMFGLYEGPETKEALQWLTDTAFQVDEFKSDYEVIRIEDPVVRDALELPRRKSMDYTYAELEGAMPILVKRMKPIQEKLRNEIPLDQLEDKINKVYVKFSKVLGAQFGLKSKALSQEGMLNQLDDVFRMMSLSGYTPLLVPSNDENRKWQVLPVASTRNWLIELAEEHDLKQLTRLTRKVVDIDVIEEVKQKMLFDEMKELLIRNGQTPEDVELVLKENGGKFPPEVYNRLLELVEPSVDSNIESRRVMADATTFRQITGIVGDELDSGAQVDPQLLQIFDEIAVAYREKDVATFNEKTELYLKTIGEMGATHYSEPNVQLEKFLNKFNPFYLAMVLYLVASLLTLLSWIGLKDAFGRSANNIVWLALSLQVVGLILRCIISGRPPVTNLYSSFVFVSAASIPIMMGVERLTKLGVGTILSSAGGFLALLTAWSISIRDGDTLSVLQAVLDTQFWLSTHVICISLGYTATVVAGSLGVAYVLGGLLTTKFDKTLSKKFSDSIYGIVCFGLLFSFFGTVLGGLWADDSWGRFWGWDPKENGALMIVLWNAVILHAKWAGMVKSRGVAVLAIVGNMVTIWSWEAVNQLGIGLHAYGFTEGRMFYIGIFWLIHLALILIGLIPVQFWRSDTTSSR